MFAQYGREISVTEMMTYVARAKMMAHREPAAAITEHLRRLTPVELVDEFHRSVAVLGAKRLLSPPEEYRLGEYAQEFLRAS